jgi:hypothetical protein
MVSSWVRYGCINLLTQTYPYKAVMVAVRDDTDFSRRDCVENVVGLIEFADIVHRCDVVCQPGVFLDEI